MIGFTASLNFLINIVYSATQLIRGICVHKPIKIIHILHNLYSKARFLNWEQNYQRTLKILSSKEIYQNYPKICEKMTNSQTFVYFLKLQHPWSLHLDFPEMAIKLIAVYSLINHVFGVILSIWVSVHDVCSYKMSVSNFTK